MNQLKQLRQPALRNPLSQPQQPSFSAQPKPQQPQRQQFFGEGDMNQWQPANPQPMQQNVQAANPDFSGGGLGMGQGRDLIGAFANPTQMLQPTGLSGDVSPMQMQPMGLGGNQPPMQMPDLSLGQQTGLNSQFQGAPIGVGQSPDLRQDYLSQLLSDFNSKRQQQFPVPNSLFEQNKEQLMNQRGMNLGNGGLGIQQQAQPQPNQMPTNPSKLPFQPSVQGMPQRANLPLMNSQQGQPQMFGAQALNGIGGMGAIGGARGNLGGMGMFGQQPQQVQPTAPLQSNVPSDMPEGAPPEYTDLRAKYDQMLQQLRALQGGQTFQATNQRSFM